MTDLKRHDIILDFGVFGDDDKVIVHYVTEGPEIEVDANAATSATSITVKPLKAAIPISTKIRFGQIDGVTAGVVKTLSAAAVYGATTLNVTAADGALTAGEKGRVCTNVTGWTPSFTVVLPPATTVLLTLTPAITTATEGVLTTTATDDNFGTTITPGQTYFYKLRRTDAGSEDTIAYGDLVLRRV